MKRVIEENKPIVTEIQKSLYRIERIIKATLMFSKGVQAQKSELSWESIARELHQAIGYYSYSKKIDFLFPEDNFELSGDLDLLVMLFSNFVFNAIDAIELDDEDEGRIVMRYTYKEGKHRFVITDTGIPIENKKWLFEAFKSTKERGNGLGLVLSKEIAKAHGGDIALYEGDEKGFVITLG
jgi:two-component system NtrC family sensor kinase/two-component system sensor histidine kinase AtoS